jgi:hypothetical protein
MALDIVSLVQPMLDAAKPMLVKSWGEAKDYAQSEARKMGETLASIEQLSAKGQITKDQAEALLDMQRHAMQAVLLTIEGIGLIAAQNAINAALGAIAPVVNKALGWPLL